MGADLKFDSEWPLIYTSSTDDLGGIFELDIAGIQETPLKFDPFKLNTDSGSIKIKAKGCDKLNGHCKASFTNYTPFIDHGETSALALYMTGHDKKQDQDDITETLVKPSS